MPEYNNKTNMAKSNYKKPKDLSYVADVLKKQKIGSRKSDYAKAKPRVKRGYEKESYPKRFARKFYEAARGKKAYAGRKWTSTRTKGIQTQLRKALSPAEIKKLRD